MRDPGPYRLLISTPLAAYAYGIAFCDWCQHPVYDQTQHGRHRALRQAARRHRLVLARRIHLVSGPGGTQQVCGACVRRVGLRARDSSS